MSMNARSNMYFMMVILVALSGAGGAVVAAQQYFLLQHQKELTLVRRTLDESFLAALKVKGGEAIPEIAKEMTERRTIIEHTDSNAAEIIRQLEIRAVIDTTAWCVVFVISGVALFLNKRKVIKPGVPLTAPPGQST